MSAGRRRGDPAIDYGLMADIYDAVVRFDRDIPFFLEECRAAGGPVLELMAGTGRVSIPLAEAGIRLTCVDRSEAMLSILRSKLEACGLQARLVRADVREMKLEGRYPLVIMPFQSFEELVEEEDRSRALHAVHRALEPGGRFLCTLHNPRVRLRSVNPEMKSLGRTEDPTGEGEIEFRVRMEHDPATGIVTGTQVLERFDGDGGPLERREMPLRFALLDRGPFEALVREHGFSVEALHGDYDRTRFDMRESPYMIWFLRRPE